LCVKFTVQIQAAVVCEIFARERRIFLIYGGLTAKYTADKLQILIKFIDRNRHASLLLQAVALMKWH
jgi:hypothetical protein